MTFRPAYKFCAFDPGCLKVQYLLFLFPKLKMIKRTLVAGLLGTFFLGVIVFIARPDVIMKNIDDVEAPIKRLIQERKDNKLAVAREQSLASWMKKYPLSPDCVYPRTDLKILECRNKGDIAMKGFERMWQERLASGWEPE